MTTDKIVCPLCERSFDLEQVEDADLWRDRADLAAKLGPAWVLANEYIEGFCASRGARLSLKKRVRILREVARLWESGVFEYNGKRYRVTQKSIQEGLYQVCQKNLVGLVNHNYLKKVLMPQSGALSAEGLTSSEEVVREQKRREGLFNADLGTRSAEQGQLGTRKAERGEENNKNTKKERHENHEAVGEVENGPFLSAEETRRRARELADRIGRKME